MQAKEVTEKVKCFMECDTNTLQALVLYGEWGTGKTYYCEHDLKAALDEIGIKICRVSLFGVSDYEEVFSRVMASVFHFCENSTDRLDAALNVLKKSVLAAGNSIVSKKLAKLRIQMSIKPDLLLTLIDMKKDLVIFDDCERSNFAQDDQTFLGFVNNMVENHGWHVMLVRNKPLSFEEDSSIEKPLWDKLHLSQIFRNYIKSRLSPRCSYPNILTLTLRKRFSMELKRPPSM